MVLWGCGGISLENYTYKQESLSECIKIGGYLKKNIKVDSIKQGGAVISAKEEV